MRTVIKLLGKKAVMRWGKICRGEYISPLQNMCCLYNSSAGKLVDIQNNGD